jgi:hypothetical protein
MGDIRRFRQGAGVRWWFFGGFLTVLCYYLWSWFRTRNADGHLGPFPWLKFVTAAGLAAAVVVVFVLIDEMFLSSKQAVREPPGSSYPCPSCGFLVFSEPPGSYEICKVCGWEDDGLQLDDPTYAGGANADSLAKSQDAILKFHPPEIAEEEGFRRDPRWRPLRVEDLRRKTDEEPDYYWLRGNG